MAAKEELKALEAAKERKSSTYEQALLELFTSGKRHLLTPYLKFLPQTILKTQHFLELIRLDKRAEALEYLRDVVEGPRECEIH